MLKAGTTVPEKAISFPRDAGSLLSHERELGRIAERAGVILRQSHIAPHKWFD